MLELGFTSRCDPSIVVLGFEEVVLTGVSPVQPNYWYYYLVKDPDFLNTGISITPDQPVVRSPFPIDVR